MTFQIIRIILWIALSVFAIHKLHKLGRPVKKTVYFLTTLLCLILVSVTVAFPLENLIVRFKSPEQLFSYANHGDIDEIIYGEDSCLILYSRGNSTGSHYIVPRENQGYVIPNVFSSKKISHKFDETGMIEVYHVKGTQDYYVFGMIPGVSSNHNIDVYDEQNEIIETSIKFIENSDFIYFTLSSFSDGHYLQHNGERVVLSE